MEGDHCSIENLWNTCCISIHSLRMEGDLDGLAESINETAFQSTPSAWRETTIPMFFFVPETFQSTPSAWRETLPHPLYRRSHGISIHSLRMEGDLFTTSDFSTSLKFQSTPSAWRETTSIRHRCNCLPFQSTPSAWRETWRKCTSVYGCGISIHSLRMEGDILCPNPYFRSAEFQSTPSAWRETMLFR